MSRKEELLRNARKMAEEEKKRRASIIQDKPLGRMTSRMPLGCWIWILLIGFAIYMLFRNASGL